MFGNKTKAEEIAKLQWKLAGHLERISVLEEALNEVTRLLAKKYRLALSESHWSIAGRPGTYLERLATTTKHVKL